ncbi:MAG: hypothetical protein ACXAEU_02335 [Candidatus Hodarchaeales archaeon]|jgi:hypothetical protein
MLDLADWLPIIYNIGFLSLFLVWIARERLQIGTRLKKIPVSYLWLFSFSFFLLMTLANFTFLITDVDDAITGAVKAFLTGANPYVDKVVPHQKPDGEWIVSVYHYFPPDLLVHSVLFILLFPAYFLLEMLGFETAWLFFANLLLVVITFCMVWLMTPSSEKKMMPPLFLALVCPFLYNNAILMLLFFTCAIFTINMINWPRSRSYLVQSLNFLSAGVKYMTGVFVLIEFMHELNLSLKQRSIKNLFPYITAGVIFILLAIPFGLIDVFVSTILYQVHPDYREDVAESKGPLLVEIMSILELDFLYFVAFLLFGLIALSLSFLRFRTIHEQQIAFSFTLMFIFPFYGTELFIVPLFAIFYCEFLRINTVSVMIAEKRNNRTK